MSGVVVAGGGVVDGVERSFKVRSLRSCVVGEVDAGGLLAPQSFGLTGEGDELALLVVEGIVELLDDVLGDVVALVLFGNVLLVDVLAVLFRSQPLDIGSGRSLRVVSGVAVLGVLDGVVCIVVDVEGVVVAVPDCVLVVEGIPVVAAGPVVPGVVDCVVAVPAVPEVVLVCALRAPVVASTRQNSRAFFMISPRGCISFVHLDALYSKRCARFESCCLEFSIISRDLQMASASSIKVTLVLLLGLGMLSCGGGSTPTASPDPVTAPSNQITSADVQSIMQKAAEAAAPGYTIAVVDRGGHILGVYAKTGTPATSVANFSTPAPTDEVAVALARTAAFFSNNEAPLSSRTVRFISGIHFPPGIAFTPNAALYGIENTNRGCPLNATFLPGKAVDPARSISGAATGLGPITGKIDVNDSDPTAVDPGGVPLFRNGELVGGIGVAGATPDVNEFAAFTGAIGAGFIPSPAAPGVVVIDGVALPFVNQTSAPAGVGPGTFAGTFTVGPISAPGPVPDGDLIAVTAGSALTQAEVQSILDQAVSTANITRAVIRLPIGQRARFAIAIADLDGHLLGLRRMPDSTIFSIDVAVAKARNMVYFSSTTVDPNDLPGVPPGTAVTNRTISFGAQPLFPAGINGSAPGPFFELYKYDTANPCTNGHQPANPNQNGVVFFPGSVPLYKNGVLVGGLGISGDGVEQDDFVSAEAAKGFEPPAAMRADTIEILGVRLPYLKFPRNPTF